MIPISFKGSDMGPPSEGVPTQGRTTADSRGLSPSRRSQPPVNDVQIESVDIAHPNVYLFPFKLDCVYSTRPALNIP
jgi:hypothetical protein